MPWRPGGAWLLAGALILGSVACAPDETSATTETSESESSTLTASTESSSTESSTETDTGDMTNDSADGSLSFYAPASDFNSVSECEPFLQDCPEGEKCVPYGSTGGNWDANKCVPVMGIGEPGDACTYGGTIDATDDCDETSFCWDVMDIEGEPIGTCTAFCMGDADNPICDEGFNCLVANQSSITLCVPACDPLLQDCDEGLGCYWAGETFSCTLQTQNLEPGQSCGFINDCAPGNLCASEELMAECGGSACCATFCDIYEPDCPEPEQVCTPMFDELGPAEFLYVGVCIVPPP